MSRSRSTHTTQRIRSQVTYLSLALWCSTPVHAQRADVEGIWEGEFSDETTGLSLGGVQTRAECEGTVVIELRALRDSIAGEVGQNERCRDDGGEWFAEVNDGWRVIRGAVTEDRLRFTTVIEAGPLGIQTCEWQAVVHRRARLTGHYVCAFTNDAAVRGEGTFEATRRQG